MNPIKRQTTTLREFIEWMARPIGWDKIFEWPPDVFAVTSAILKRTGAYRYVISPPGDANWPPKVAEQGTRKEWREWVDAEALKWLDGIGCSNSSVKLPRAIGGLKRTVQQNWTIPMDALYELETDDEGAGWRACEALLSLHAIADHSCVGFGTPTSPTTTPEIQFRADSMLAQTGSLSRLPRVKGLVLPKMRTPQTGLTLRATSLYATWHETEVDVQWRTVPWVNTEENTLNVLILPWPAKVEPTDFARAAHPAGQRTVGNDRYFVVNSRETFKPEHVLEALNECRDKVNQVHT